MTAELTHFIGGKHVKGTSGRFGDVFQPMDGSLRAQCAAGLQGRGGAPPSRMPRPRSRPGPPPTRSAARAC